MRRIVFIAAVISALVYAVGQVESRNFNILKTELSVLGSVRDTLYSVFSSTKSVPSPRSSSGMKPVASDPATALPSANEAGSAAGTPAGPPDTGAAASAPAGTAASPLTAADRAGADFLRFLEEKQFFGYTEDRWNKMREDVEAGRTPGEEEVAGSSRNAPAVQAPPPVALPPGLSVELPYESQLSISGRKAIGITMKSTIYDKPEAGKRVNSSSLDMSQELQVRIKGRVGKKINVNVDFDDTREDKRDISVVYKGDPGEVVQEAAFGDISMSLPSTEFVGYSRQLFGVKVDTRYKKLHTMGFFSRTKGFSEVKRFTGNTKLERKTIADTSYIPLKYYLLKFDSDAIKNGSARIYRDDRNLSNNTVTTSTNTLAETLTTPTTTYRGDFDLLVPGQDYTIDYSRGIIIFRNQLTSNHVVAVDYQRENGTWLSAGGTNPGAPKIIKDEANTIGITREMKTFYSLGALKIIRDNGRGNFILKVQDLNGSDPASLEPGGKTVPAYPQNISVDFESGVFNFEPADGKPFPDDLYTVKTHRYNMLAEYRYRIKFVMLRPGIVPQSERVTMDGRVLQRDSDFFIDYDAGIVTFFNEERINENTVIEVSYDYAPFGTSGGSTLVGLRSELSLTNNIFIGSSFIYDFATRTQSVPDVRNAPSSLMVWEADARVQNVQIPRTPLQVSMSGEFARSQRNPNIMNKAVVESMEGVKQEDSASLHYESWVPGTNSTGDRYGRGDVSWHNEEVLRKDINPNLTSEYEEKQQVLNVGYDLNRSSAVSLTQSLSTVGLDFSKKLYIETWIFGDGKGAELSIAYGAFNEDADGDGVLDTEDRNGDGTLNTDEDTGWSFNNPDGSITAIGAGNGKIDSEDLDNDGSLRRFDTIAHHEPYGTIASHGMTDNEGNAHTTIDWQGWKLFRIPLQITQPLDWQSIKQVRLTISGTGRQQGSIKIGSLSAVSNRWEPSGTWVAGSSLTITGINNEENPDYAANSLLTHPDYQSLYELRDTGTETTRREQALSLKYEVTDSTTAELAAKLAYGRPYDLSNYRQLKFFLNNRSGSSNDTFFIQIGNDTNYYEYSAPLSGTGWQHITVHQVDKNNDGKPDWWAVNANGDQHDPATGARTRTAGSPSFLNISQIRIGVRASGPGKTGEFWVNEIYAADSYLKAGNAWRANLDFNWPGWGTFGAKRKQIDPNFETFSAGIYNRDYLEDSAYLNFSKLSYLPVSASLNRTRTVTPSVVQTQGDLVSIAEEGRVTSYTGSGQASFNMGQWPRLGLQYNRAITDTALLDRLEDRETVSGTIDYTNPLRFALLPTSLSGNYSHSDSYFRTYPVDDPIADNGSDFIDFKALDRYLNVSEYNTLEFSDTYGIRAPFQFWNGFNLSTNYSLSTVQEKNKLFAPVREYPKSASQSVGANSTLRVFKWLQPGLSYNVNINENYNLQYSTSTPQPTYPSQTKYVERNSTAELTWNLQMRDLVAFPYTQSLNFSSSYRRQDSDSYENVAATDTVIGSADKLWIRGFPLGIGTLKSMVKKDDIRVSGRYNPFEAFTLTGRLAPLKSMTMNLTYTANEEDSFITGTSRETYTKIWPDLILSVNQAEKMLWLEKLMSDFQINLRHQKKVTNTTNVSRNENRTYGGDLRFYFMRKLDLNFSINSTDTRDYDLGRNILTQEGNNLTWSGQTGINLDRWRFTLRYESADNTQQDGSGTRTITDTHSRTYTLQAYSDMSFPQGLPLPFTHKTLPLTNRMIFTSTLKYQTLRSSLNVGRDNTDTYGLNLNADYEVSQNFRVSLGAGYSRVVNKHTPDENYSNLEASGRLTIQF